MIYNRTENDVNEAKKIRIEKVQKFQVLTDSEIEILEKGVLTINTLNRIESKQEELKNLFNALGYWNTSIVNKAWDEIMIFDVDDFKRIINNSETLRQAFFVYTDTPKTPPMAYDIKTFNDLEKLLHDLDVMINDVKSGFRKCGTFKCGGKK